MFARSRWLPPAVLLLAACGQAATPAEQEPASTGAEVQPAAATKSVGAAAAATQPASEGKATAMTEMPTLVRGQSRLPVPLQGEWTVARQTTTGGGVQAYGDNDPALIGARLRITPSQVAWLGSTAPLTGKCEDAYFDTEETAPPSEWAASLKRLGTNVADARQMRFVCMGEASSWGPSGEQLDLLLLADGRLVVSGFDNLLLVLEKTASR